MELYKHQREAFDKFKDSNEIALFFEQGCGKSATALKIAEYKYKQGMVEQLLVIAPNDVHHQWAYEQVPLWLECPHTVECFFGRGGKAKFYEPNEEGKLAVAAVNIDTFSLPDKWKQIAEWARARPTMIVLDEATSIKNFESNRTQRIMTCFNNITRRGKAIMHSEKHPNCLARCVLTGTPVTNGPMDLWSIMEFVRPNFFNRNWYDFRQYYGMFSKLSVGTASGMRQVSVMLNEQTWRSVKLCKDYATAWQVFGVTQDTYFTVQSQDKFDGPYKHADELKEILQTTAMFKKIQECIDMPEQVFIVKTLQMNKEQQAAYKDMALSQAAEYEGRVATALNKLTMATRLQQISSGFLQDKSYGENFDPDQDIKPEEVVWLGKTNPKLEALKRDIDESAKPVIVLTRYSAEAAKIYDMLKDEYSTLLYTGWKKTGKLDDFKEGKYDVLVANLQCVAYGFNLQNSCSMLYYSNSFSMELREQSQARIFRSGQKNVCKYVDYCFEGTIDETILKALKRKKSMLEWFREEEQEAAMKK